MEKITFSGLFSEAFKRHTTADAEDYFILGAPTTTPDISKTPPELPHPWLFSRVLLMSILAFFGFYIGAFYFNNPNFLPGLIIFGAFLAPISLLIFFWEINILRNISVYKLIKLLFKGGIVALLYTVILYTVTGGNTSPLMIGFVEETAKVLALLLLVDHKNYRYILNGLLLGAAIGTGFAAFESAGYILVSALKYGMPTMINTIFWRAIFAPGNHIAWAGLVGAALIEVKGDRPFRLSMLLDLRFLLMYVLVIMLHALWDARFSQLQIYYVPIVPVVLTVLSWIILFAMMKRGFKQAFEIAPQDTNGPIV